MRRCRRARLEAVGAASCARSIHVFKKILQIVAGRTVAEKNIVSQLAVVISARMGIYGSLIRRSAAKAA
jgi:hypothetical protein